MAAFEEWLGRKEITDDAIELGLTRRIAATLDQDAPKDPGFLPLLWHWAFFQPVAPASGIGADGHPKRGGFLPPVEGRNRMWAGGRLEFFAPFKIGVAAQRISTIRKIEEKHGRTGALLFVTVEHDYRQDGERVLLEEQDLVYREPAKPKIAAGEPCPDGEWQEEITSDPVLLFRYSAVTFNSHRIHYDYPYVTQVEGYPDLVVQGPLLATLVLRAFCRANPQARVTRFSFRSGRPLIHPVSFTLSGRKSAAGEADLWAGNAQGMAQTAKVLFDDL